MKFEILSRGTIKVDGGAMFGIVPRVFWSKNFPPDEKNNILLSLTSLLIQTSDYTALVDPARAFLLGEEYQYQEEKKLLDQLGDLKISPEDITHVIFTHLHTDHMEGLFGEKGEILFPKARLVVQKKELEFALHPSPRTVLDYDPQLVERLSKAPHLVVVEGKAEVAPGLFVEPSPGHTLGHQHLWCLREDGSKLVFPGDLIPTAAHIPLPYIASFDTHPKNTCESKRELLSTLTPQDLLVFFHDPKIKAGRIVGEVEKWTVEAVESDEFS